VRRPGLTRVNSSILRDCCVRLDGYNDYGRLILTPAARLAFGCEVRLNSFPAAEVTLISRGFGTGASRYLQISYDPTSGNGVWRCRAYDATAGALRNVTISDGDTARSQVSANRHIELTTDSGGTATFAVKDGTGSSIGSTTFTWASTVATGAGVSDWFIGNNSTDGIAAPAEGDSSHGPFSLAVMRFGDGTDSAELAACQVVGRELYAVTTENSGLDGYFKLNEGWGAQSSSSQLTTTKILWGRQTPEWVTDPTRVFGSAGLRFNGDEGHVFWDATNFGTHTFTSTATGAKKWLLTFLFVPRMDQSEATVRNQTVLWTGTGATNPAPIGVRVASDNLVIDYYNGALTSITIPTALSTYVNKRIRVQVSYNDLATDSIFCIAKIEGVTPSSFASGNPGATNPTCSSTWTIGRNLSSATYPFTYNTRTAFCEIDDVCLFKDYDPNAGNGPQIPASLAMREATDQTVYNGGNGMFSSSIQLVAGLRLNEGGGNYLNTIGSKTSTAYLWPEEEDGVLWDTDLVDPDVPAEIDLIYNYRVFGASGTLTRKKLVVIGGAILTMTDAGVVQYVGTIKKRSNGTASKVSVAQYASSVFLARENGDRPIRFDGTTTNLTGIRAPLLAPVVTGATSGGALADGTYTVYFTYRNSTTGSESNPSPYGTVVISGGGGAGRIDAVVLQRAGDPQVNQRRIYVTAVGGGANSTAYLSATVDDNTTTNYTTDITAVGVLSGVTLEYTDNEEAPVGSMVRVFKDMLVVAGDPVYPTRSFPSIVGSPTAFNQTTRYIDADLDSGHVITGLGVIANNLAVMFSDGLRLYAATGDTTNPLIPVYESLDAGPVGSRAFVETASGIFYVGERSAFLWTGSGVQDLANPAGFDRPSIRYTWENHLDGTVLDRSVVAFGSAKSTVYFAVPATNGIRTLVDEQPGNDMVLTLDLTQGVWSKWWMDSEFIAEIENADDLGTIYVGAYGFISYLDESARFDGATTGTPADHLNIVLSTSGKTATITTSPYGSTNLKGMLVYHYLAAAQTTSVYRIMRNTASTLVLNAAISISDPSGGDYLIPGGIPWFADFFADFGNPLTLKRLRWVKSACVSRATFSSNLIVAIGTDVLARRANDLSTFPLTYSHQTTPTTTPDVFIAGHCRTVLVRFSDGPVGVTVTTGAIPFPSYGSRFDIVEFQIEAEEVAAR